MKRFIPVAALGALFFTACKEKPPLVKFGEDIAKDTTYVSATVPVPQARNVLIEEYTGASCTNCPAAHDILKQYEAQHPGRLNAIGLYIKGPIQTVPPHEAIYDFRHQDATTISKEIFGGVSQLPSAGIDRIPFLGNIKIERGNWGSAIESGLAIPDSINLTLASTFDDATGKATIVATIEYPYAISFPHSLSLAIVQDSIIDFQEYPTTDLVHPGGDEDYDFTNVLRTVITTLPSGDAIYPSIAVKEPGRTVVKVYTFDTNTIGDRAEKPEKLPPFVAAHSRVIGWITSNETGSYRVLQSAQIDMK